MDKYHEILGVPPDASAAQVKAAFRKLAHRYHPDISSEANAKERFIEVVEAYRALTENKYSTSSATSTAKDAPEGSRYRANRNSNALPLKGSDCHMDVRVSIEELYWGVELKIDPSQACHGRRTEKGWRNSRLLKVKLQRGTRQGARLRLAGKGEAGKNGGPAGDIYLSIQLKPHSRYEVSGENLYVDMPLSRWEAAEGAIVDLITPAGRIEVDVPAGIVSGQSVRIPGRGLPNESQSGDLFAIARIVDANARATEHKWPHIPHAGTMRWQTVGQRQGNRIDIRA